MCARSSPVAIAAIFVAMLVSARSFAGDSASDAAQVALEGLREFQLGHWAEAMALFDDSSKKRPSAKMQRGIAKCLFELRMYVRAIDACDRALTESHEALPEDLAEDVRSLRARALRFTNEVVIELTPPHAKALIDGKATPASLRLELGTHSVRVEAEGYDPQVSQFEVVANGPRMMLRFALQASAVPPQPHRPSVTPPLLGALGAAVATTAAALYVADRGNAIHDCETLAAQGSGCSNVAALERERTGGIAVTVLGASAFIVCGYFVFRVLTMPSATPRAALHGGAWLVRF